MNIRRLYAISAVVLTVYLILFCLSVSATHAQGGVATQTPTPDAQDILLTAQQLATKAQQTLQDATIATQVAQGNNSSFSFVLNVVGIVGIVLAVFSLIIGVSGYNFSQRQQQTRQQLDDGLQKLETGLAAIAALDVELLKALPTQITKEMTKPLLALSMVQIGQDQLNAGNSEAALNTFEQAYNLDPQNRAANYYLGWLYIGKRDLKNAYEHLEATKLDGEEYPPAKTAAAYGKYLEAEQFIRANAIDAANGLYAYAEHELLRLINVDKYIRDINDESIYALVGMIYFRKERYNDAIRMYLQATSMTPYNSFPFNDLGFSYAATQQNDFAVNAFMESGRRALAEVTTNPRKYWAWLNLAISALVQNRTEEAVTYLSAAVKYIVRPRALKNFRDTVEALKSSSMSISDIDIFIEQIDQSIGSFPAE